MSSRLKAQSGFAGRHPTSLRASLHDWPPGLALLCPCFGRLTILPLTLASSSSPVSILVRRFDSCASIASVPVSCLSCTSYLRYLSPSVLLHASFAILPVHFSLYTHKHTRGHCAKEYTRHLEILREWRMGGYSGGVKQGLVKCKRDDVAESEMVSHDRGAQRTGEFFGCPSSLELTERIEVDKQGKGKLLLQNRCARRVGESERMEQAG